MSNALAAACGHTPSFPWRKPRAGLGLCILRSAALGETEGDGAPSGASILVHAFEAWRASGATRTPLGAPSRRLCGRRAALSSGHSGPAQSASSSRAALSGRRHSSLRLRNLRRLVCAYPGAARVRGQRSAAPAGAASPSVTVTSRDDAPRVSRTGRRMREIFLVCKDYFPDWSGAFCPGRLRESGDPYAAGSR